MPSTLVRNNQPEPLALPAPFRGVLAGGGTFYSRLSPDRIKWHLGVGVTPSQFPRQLVVVGPGIPSAEPTPHAPDLDEWFGSATTQGPVPQRVVFAGPASELGKLLLPPDVAFLLSVRIAARRLDAPAGAPEFATFDLRVSGQTDDKGIVGVPDIVPATPDVNASGYVVTPGVAGFELAFDVAGKTGRVRFTVRAAGELGY